MATSVINVGGQRVGVQVIPSAQVSVSSNCLSTAAAAPGRVGASKVSGEFEKLIVWFSVIS